MGGDGGCGGVWYGGGMGEVWGRGGGGDGGMRRWAVCVLEGVRV